MVRKKITVLTVAVMMAFSVSAFGSDYNTDTSMLTITATTADRTTNAAIDTNKKIENPITLGKTATVKVGKNFSIVIEENATTGYTWSYKADAKAFKLVKEFNNTINPDKNLVGAPTNKVFVFKALKKGTYKIKLSYTRSWENDVKPIKTAEYKIVVK